MKKKNKVLSVFGTRPETIKMAPLVKALEANEAFESLTCVTAQHRQMLDQVLQAYHLHPDYDLNIMQEGQGLTEITSRVLLGMQPILQETQPDIVLVHGDTSTAFAAGLAAFYRQLPIGHVEAGLRTYDKYSPFPEEMNRCLLSRLADWHFAPTEASRRKLLDERIPDERIVVTGNTAIDALYLSLENTKPDAEVEELLRWVGKRRLLLLTAHRRENLGEPMRRMFLLFREFLDQHEDLCLIYPVHLNPQVRKLAREVLEQHPRVRLIEPLEVFGFHHLLQKAWLVLTDSGGIQEEAPSLGKPVLVLRDTTERPEGVEAGTLRLVGTEVETIAPALEELLTNEKAYRRMQEAPNPYGDGQAAQRIVEALYRAFSKEAL